MIRGSRSGGAPIRGKSLLHVYFSGVVHHYCAVINSGEAAGPREPGSLEDDVCLVGIGDRVAFIAVYERMVPRVFGLVRRILVDPSQAEEVTQEVFLEVWRTAPRYQPSKGTATTWILTMARGRAIDRVRASQSSRERDLRVGARQIEREYDSVAEHAEILDRTHRVHSSLRQLSILQRQAVELAYVSELSYPEISAMLKVSVGTVKTRVRDGLIRLRKELTTR